MNYQNGKAVNIGDSVVGFSRRGQPIVGTVSEIRGESIVVQPPRLEAIADPLKCVLAGDVNPAADVVTTEGEMQTATEQEQSGEAPADPEPATADQQATHESPIVTKPVDKPSRPNVGKRKRR